MSQNHPLNTSKTPKRGIKFNKNIPVSNLSWFGPKNEMLSKFNEIWHSD